MQKFKIVVEEGLGDYAKSGGPASKLHPNGRLGAKLTVYNSAGTAIYETKNASTLPDGINDKYKSLMDNDIAITCPGTYKLYTHRHHWRTASKYRAFQLGDYSEAIPCIRRQRKSTASGINLHYRSNNDDWRSSPKYMWSCGCITVDYADMTTLIKAMGLSSADFDKHLYIADIVIKREYVPENVRTYIDEMCGDMASLVYQKSAEEVESDRKAEAIAGYKEIIQSNIGYSNPDAVWELMDAHPYAEDLYRKWAESYK